MHEWTLAESILKSVITQANANNLHKVLRIGLSVGELQMITADTLKFCVQTLSVNTLLAETEWDINIIPGSRDVKIEFIEGEDGEQPHN